MLFSGRFRILNYAMRKWLWPLVVVLLAVAVLSLIVALQRERAQTAVLDTRLSSQMRLLAQAGRVETWKTSAARARDDVYRKEVTDRFHQVYYDGQSWEQNVWLGVKAQQNPNDAWIIQELIHEQKPDFIVETGTLQGGSALLWLTILEQVNPNARVITVDIEDQVTTARDHPLWKKVDVVLGSSTDPGVIAEVKRRVGNGKVLLILDSLHTRDHVLRELELYSPLVGVGGYIVVQDSNLNGRPVMPEYGPGPGEAVDDFLAKNKSFVQDRQRERLLMTMHPGGYLKRVS